MKTNQPYYDPLAQRTLAPSPGERRQPDPDAERRRQWDNLVEVIAGRMDLDHDGGPGVGTAPSLGGSKLPEPLLKGRILRVLALEIVNRAELLEDFAVESQEPQSTIVKDYIDGFADDFCDRAFRLAWSDLRPLPLNWSDGKLTAADLTALANELSSGASQAPSRAVAEVLAGAASKFLWAASIRD